MITDGTAISESSGKISKENQCEGCYGNLEINDVLDFATESLDNKI
jgi:hypothetical protein